MDERPKTVPEIRGHKPIPSDRADAYSAASYSAQYGITVEDAEELIEGYGKKNSHPDIHRAILRMFKEDETLKWRALNPQKVEDQEREKVREEAKRQIEEARRLRIQRAKEEEEAKKKAAEELEKQKEGEVMS